MRADHPILARRGAWERQGRRGPWVALFDIDSTLMDTGPRNLAILKAAGEAIPGLAPWVERLDLGAPGWNILDPLAQAGVEPEVLALVETFWQERFFTHEWLVHDRPYPGVPAFLHDLVASGFRLVYLTGRDAPGMEAGTRKSFADQGLPVGPGATFLFKPTFAQDDGAFKASACAAVGALGTVVVTVDNEPGNVNRFIEAFPEAWNVWIDTLTSPRPEALRPEAVRMGPREFYQR